MANIVARAAYQVARIFGADDVIRATTRLPSVMGTKVLPDLALWNQFQRVGGSLTPGQVSSIIRAADTGDMRRLVDLANDSRQKDGHLQSILSQAEEAICELDWQLTIPESASAKAKRAAKKIEAMLRACKGTASEEKDSFADLIGHMTGGFFYGYACAESEFVKRDGLIVPRAFHCHAPRRFGFRQTDGKFVWRDENMGWDGVAIRDQFPGKFVLAQPRVTGDVPCREGLARVLVWAALFRNWTISDWLRTAELAWKPWRIGYYDKAKTSDEDIDGLETVLENLSTNGSAKLPNTCEIDISWAQGAGSRTSTHAELFDVVGREMSKAVLGATDTIDGSKARGYAQGKIQGDGEKRRIRSRAKYIGTVITRDVIAPLTAMNFGPDVEVADFEFVLKEPVDLAAFGEGVAKLVSAGAKVTQAYVQTQTGMPAPKETDELLKPAALASAEAIAANGASSDEEPDEDDQSDGEGDDAANPDAEDENDSPPKKKPAKPAKKPGAKSSDG